MNPIRTLFVACAASLAVAGAAVAAETDAVLAQVVAGDWRAPEDRARDEARHPVEALTFWGLEPGMTLLEVQPGGGWWTDILAPYARRTGGRYFATGPDLGDPELSDRAREYRSKQEEGYAAKAGLYGEVGVVNWGRKSAPPPAGQFDFALVSRSFHGWMRQDGFVEKALGDLYTALKPGGVLAIVQHRADPGEQDPKAASGYVTEAYVIGQVEKAGFKLDGKSEVNANPKDTKDHPFGVWTLPPARRSTPYGSGQEADPNFDHSKYDAIGESDRMTLRFVKPE
ncbi:MAG: methyltransferase [Gammaproteobacteria bacterium SG8_30]|nr:MAG: methyltransferase [Gammaproteobacteria bacterium SG8_30]